MEGLCDPPTPPNPTTAKNFNFQTNNFIYKCVSN